MLQIGPHKIKNRLILAPMAGVTDRPFRELCRQFDAGLTVSEMVSSNPALRSSRKTQLRLSHQDEPAPISVQIAGGDPEIMAEGARFNVNNGAQIIDINMGCPAKKVCKKAAGSALLQDEDLVKRILHAVVDAVSVPVTLKIRTGWNRNNKNGVTIAKIAEQAGICALAVHGRTRADKYLGTAEYDTIKAIKQSVSIPIFANGDINSPEQAQFVLNYTGADAIMIGRAAQGRPWIFREIDHYLATDNKLAAPTQFEIRDILLSHLEKLYQLYGKFMGVRIARKHVGWYLKTLDNNVEFRRNFNQLETTDSQLTMINNFLSHESVFESS